MIQGSKELLVTAFVNLIDNARKASVEGQCIELTGKTVTDEAVTDEEKTDEAVTDEVWYEVMVVDYGIGMTKEEAQRICDEFYMIDKSRARREGGAGIGMSLVSVILEHHKAKLLIESTPGKGTRMCVRFRKEEKDEAAKRS